MVFSKELHRRYADQGIVSVALHPGNLQTDLQRHVSKVEMMIAVRSSVVPAQLLYPSLVFSTCRRNIFCTPHQWEHSHNYMRGLRRRARTLAARYACGIHLCGQMCRTVLTQMVQYLIPWARVGRAKKETEDPEIGRKLWEWLENEVKNV